MIRKTFHFVMFNGKCFQNIPHKKASIVNNNSFRNKLINQVIVLMIKYLNDNLLFQKQI